MTKHEWRDRTSEGERIYYRAYHHAGRWTFAQTLESDEDWHDGVELPLDVLRQFREVLWNKHLRRRVPLKHVDQIDALIEERSEMESGDPSEDS